ncbi:hypothetical protein HK096_001323, partial [Nowakowskiella sp. JEL0078]
MSQHKSSKRSGRKRTSTAIEVNRIQRNHDDENVEPVEPSSSPIIVQKQLQVISSEPESD